MDDDIFDDQISENESRKQLIKNETNSTLHNLRNLNYSEGFLAGSNISSVEKYQEYYTKGKNYSISFGALLGRVELYIALENLKLLDISSGKKLVSKDELVNIRNELNEFKLTISNDIIEKYSSLLDELI